MIGWDGPPLRDCAGKTKGCRGNSQGWRRRVCPWCCAWSGEMDIGRRNGGGERSVVLCHSRNSPSLCSASLPVSGVAPLLSSWSEWEENKRCISMRQLRGNSFSRSVSLWWGFYSFIYKPHNSAWSGYCTIYQYAVCLMAWKRCEGSLISYTDVIFAGSTEAAIYFMDHGIFLTCSTSQKFLFSLSCLDVLLGSFWSLLWKIDYQYGTSGNVAATSEHRMAGSLLVTKDFFFPSLLSQQSFTLFTLGLTQCPFLVPTTNKTKLNL